MTLEAWLDETPGETRGVIARDGRFERLILQREDDPPAHRLGARLIGRVAAADPTIGAAFIDLGAGSAFGFLPQKRAKPVREGESIEVEVTAEPRGDKGPALALIGPGDGAPRLITPGRDAAQWLARWAPDVTPITGAAAIQAGWDAEEEALSTRHLFSEQGVDLAVERTRALVSVDIDYHGRPGRDGRRDRGRANRFALKQAARLIRLKAWGGLVIIDLVGSGHDGPGLSTAARADFAPDGEVALGPISRFGLMQLSLPWRRRPLEDILLGPDSRPTARSRAQAIVSRMRHAALADTTVAVLTLRCHPNEAILAAPLAARLGPRLRLVADPTLEPGAVAWQER